MAQLTPVSPTTLMGFMMINGIFLPKKIIFNTNFPKKVFAKFFNLSMLQNSFPLLIYNFGKSFLNMKEMLCRSYEFKQ